MTPPPPYFKFQYVYKNSLKNFNQAFISYFAQYFHYTMLSERPKCFFLFSIKLSMFPFGVVTCPFCIWLMLKVQRGLVQGCHVLFFFQAYTFVASFLNIIWVRWSRAIQFPLYITLSHSDQLLSATLSLALYLQSLQFLTLIVRLSEYAWITPFYPSEFFFPQRLYFHYFSTTPP